MSKWAEARDGNEKDIIKALERAGAIVQKLTGGNGRPDLLVGFGGCDFKIEVKNPTSAPSNNAKSVKAADVIPGGKYYRLAIIHGAKRVRRLNLKQAEWFTTWQGTRPNIVFTAEEALDIIGATTPAE